MVFRIIGPKALRVIATVTLLVATGAVDAGAQTANCEPGEAEAYLDINDVRARIFNNGNLFWRRGTNVYEVPAGEGVSALFTQGFYVGGLVNGEVRMAAARYGNHEFWAGPIDEVTGLPPSDCADFDHIYRVSKSDVAAYEAGGEPAADLRNWPTGLGAPTLAGDGSRIDLLSLPLSQRLNRVIDLDSGERPAFTGDQMLWWVMNDVGNEHRSTHGPPVGVEVHVTAFAFGAPQPLRVTTFYRYRILYRGLNHLESAYIGFFQDMDLGYFGDDYVGIDTTLGLAFACNADNDDQFYGVAPPSIGLDLVQGPIVPDPEQTALFRDRVVDGGRNLDLTGFVFYAGGAGLNGEPDTALENYRYLQSLWKDGRPIREGNDGLSTDPDAPIAKFMFPGNPVSGSFWSEVNIDGTGRANPPADRRYIASSGPFDMQPGSEQEIVVALVWARGVDNLDSISELRRSSRLVQSVADSNFDTRPPLIEPPLLTATSEQRSVGLSWSNPDTSNNANEAFSNYAPVVNATYRFEGYEVYRFDSATDSVGTRIATYDLDNGVRRVIDKSPYEQLTELAADGTDSGIRHEHTIAGLDNHRTYHFGVQAYAYQDGYYPKVIRSAMARVSVEPHPGLEAASPEEVLGAIGIVPNPYYAASEYEVSGGESEVRFVNVPAGSTARVFTLSGSLIRKFRQEGAGSIHWDLTNAAGRRVASSVFLVHVDVPDVGTRLLKFSIVARREVSG